MPFGIIKKAVKAVAKVVKGVAKGVTKVVQGVGKVVKKVANSKIGKIVIAAAGLYFGVPMLSGALGGASAGFAAGQGFLGTIGSTLSGAFSGAAAGLGQAWAGLQAAGSALLGGQFAQAGSALMSGASPTAAFGAGASAATPITSAIGAAAGAPTNAALIEGSVPALQNAAASMAKPGFSVGSTMSNVARGVLTPSTQPTQAPSWESKVGTALIEGAAGALDTYADYKLSKDQLNMRRKWQLEDEARLIERMNQNMGVLDLRSDKDPSYYQKSSFAGRFSG